MVVDIKRELYSWPKIQIRSPLDEDFEYWAGLVEREIQPVIEYMHQPLPDDPVALDTFITKNVEGWGPRVAALAVTAEWYLQSAKSEKFPEKIRSADGKPLNTEADRASEFEGLLKDYRFVRNFLDMLVTSIRDRIRWAQSVRKQHADVQSGF